MKELTREQFEAQLENEKNICKDTAKVVPISSIGKKINENGRGQGNTEIPLEMKSLLGVLAKKSGSETVAKEFGVSKHSVDNYRNGKVNHIVKPELVKMNKDIEKKAKEKAAEIVLRNLGLIDSKDEDFESMSVKELIGTTIGLATIRDKMSDKNNIPNVGAQVIIYAPQQKEKSAYSVVEIGE